MHNYIKNWKQYLLKEQTGYEYKSFQILVRIRTSKELGGDKYETIGEIRSIPGVTVVSYVPESGREDSSHYYDTVKVKFCCTQSVKISPRSFVYRILRKEMNKIQGINVEKFVGNIERVA